MSETKSGALVAELIQHHQQQAVLCKTLEKIADELPGAASRQACLSVARTIFLTVKAAHQFEENDLFPYLQLHFSGNKPLENSLERLRFEHWEDESFAEEVSECLREYVMVGRPEVAEKLSYMLRGFFEGLRRHMAFESEHLLPLLTKNASSPL